jgi:hypothetical protein
MQKQIVLNCALALAAGATLFVPTGARAAVPASATVAAIPAGSVIDSATFSIAAFAGAGAYVNVHRITAPWSETTVTWNNFGGAFDPAGINTFLGSPGWCSADVTGLVQAWVDGSVPNHGLLLEQGLTDPTLYHASEFATPALRPMLDIFYTPPGGSLQEVVIQRPGAAADTVQDAYIWQLLPDSNNNYDTLYTGNVSGLEKQTLVQFDITVTPGCPECVSSEFGLGAAGHCTVLEVGTGSSVSITGPAGGILGDICIAPGAHLSMSGSEYITGDIRLGAGATFSNSSSGTIGTVFTNVDLSAEINDANAATAALAGLPCTQVFNKLDNTLTIAGNGGLNVICVGDVVLNGKTVTLAGGPSDHFVLNVTGKFVLNGGGKILVAGGVPASNVIYNVLGTGPDVAFTGGGGGLTCCNSVVDGTVLAILRKIALSPGMVHGEVISSKNISIVSGSSVRCPACP